MSFFLRLKEERERLGVSQTVFAEFGGVKKGAQILYEKGERLPDVGYLSGLARAGADVLYLITGIRSGAALTSDEKDLLSLFRAAPLAVKAAAIGALSSHVPQVKKKAKILIEGNIGQQNNTNQGGVFVVNMKDHLK